MTNFSFHKTERISAKKEIDYLFQNGVSFVAYPLRLVYCKIEPKSDLPVSILISVSKKKFKRAVKRNRLKRLIREAYRLNKKGLLEATSSAPFRLLISFIYLPNNMVTYSEMEKGMKKALEIMKKTIE